ncbi:uncharacterized protein [Littorina saxatilis]|uniref:Uncharacterized protein n=1 Tax=Littorina saxatilis TaxID=31220 RepID=A0AAN9G0W8_9CAEN
MLCRRPPASSPELKFECKRGSTRNMGGCITRQERDPRPLIIDVQQVIADEVWGMFCDSQTCWARRFLKRSDYIVDVPMNYYDFEEVDQVVEVRNQRGGHSRVPERTESKKKKLAGSSKDISKSWRDLTSPEHVGLETDFRNNTVETQTYNFKFEKTRKAAVNVNYQKGFSIGNKTKFSVGLPKVLPGGEISSEFSAHVSVTKTTGETFEETLTTTATSDITVAPKSHYIASIVMEEYNLHAEFKVTVNMSMPAKQAKAYIKDKHGDTVFYYTLKNLSHLFPQNKIEVDDPKRPGSKKAREDAVQFVVEGVLNGVQMSSHKIKLDSQDLEGAEEARDRKMLMRSAANAAS